MLGIARCKILKIEMDGMRAVFMEGRQHLSARCCCNLSKFVLRSFLMVVGPPQTSFAGFPDARNTILTSPTYELPGGKIRWNIEALSQDLTMWLTMDEANPPATSRLGILCSPNFQEILRHSLGEHICTNLRLLVMTSFIIHCYRDYYPDSPGYDQVTFISQRAGAELLKSLETALKNDGLTQASKEKLLSLYLVLLGTIFAVKYTVSGSLEEAGGMLLRILAHYLVLIGERVGLFVNGLTKILIEALNLSWIESSTANSCQKVIDMYWKNLFLIWVLKVHERINWK